MKSGSHWQWWQRSGLIPPDSGELRTQGQTADIRGGRGGEFGRFEVHNGSVAWR
jgi:hypothetical protein